jgi:formylglycine-generating enzyme
VLGASIVASCVAASCSGPEPFSRRHGSGGSGGAATGSGGAGTGASSDGGGEPRDAGADSDGATFDCVVVGIPGHCVETSACAETPLHASTPGHCPGAEDVQCCTPFGEALCDPTAIPTPNAGRSKEAPGVGGCPRGMIRVTDFCIDRFEASLVRVDDGSSWSPYFNPGAVAVRAVSVAGAVPQGYIDGDQASEACLASGKRLCTDVEWLRACRGPDDFTYPYGDAEELGRCNDHRSMHPAVQYFGTSDAWIWSEIDNPCLNQLPEGLARTGAFAECESAEGAFDMMGNLHEWTADPAGTFRGGFYVDTELNGPGCLYATTAHNTLHWDYSTGFRCCAEL